MGRWLTLLRAAPAVAMRRGRAALAAQRGHLFVWAPVCLGAGIGVYFSLPVEPPEAALLAAGVCGCLLLVGARLWSGGWSAPGIGLGLLLLGLALAGARAHHVAAPQLGFRHYGPIEGRVIAMDRSASDVPRLTLDHVRLLRLAPERTPQRVRVALHGAPELQARTLDLSVGQTVALTGHLMAPGGPVEPGGFDFRRNAWFARIGAVGYSRTPVVLVAPAQGGQWLVRARMALSARVQAKLPGEIGAFAAALMTGDRSAMGQDTRDALRHTNLAHLLAISGLHMGLLSGFVFGAARLLLLLAPRSRHHWPGKKIAAIVALLAAAGYLALSGGNVATQRAFIMVAVMLGAVLADLRALSLRAVALAALLLLVLRPEALLGPGFQMSFAATTALVCVFGALRAQTPLPRWARPALALLLSSAVASAATAPFSMAHFNMVSRYGLLANLLAVPAMGLLAVPMAVLAALLMPLGLDGLALQGMALGLRWILAVAQEVASWDAALGHVVAPTGAVLPLIALGGLFVMLWQGLGRWAGLIPLALGVFLWSKTERPSILISQSGALVGVMTERGRALSREVGEGFTAKLWLENDGQPADQAAAAALWPGAVSRLRRAQVAQTEVLHVSGTRAAATISGCDGAALLVSNVPLPAPPGCEVFDPDRLKTTGAVAFQRGPGGLQMQVSRRSPPRLWEGGASWGQ
ncbi:ComEC/Rec2 family competence protein [Alloyangia pacifica]|uniref:ComEC/Rec2 family competence protein n=1 Tax=Alloyangia pacifica TaxID=311180 RepID=UPI001CFD1D68|nr:ComEC/Rec2 family competence protein [Alloyangia pacifica]